MATRMHNSLIVALGGFTTPTKKTRVLFCREVFDYAELEEHPYLCNHLGNFEHLIGRFKFKFNNFLTIGKTAVNFGHIPTKSVINQWPFLNYATQIRYK